MKVREVTFPIQVQVGISPYYQVVWVHRTSSGCIRNLYLLAPYYLVRWYLEVIPPEEKHRIYKMLRMKVLVNIEGTVTVEIVSGKVPEPDTGSVNSGDLCS